MQFTAIWFCWRFLFALSQQNRSATYLSIAAGLFLTIYELYSFILSAVKSWRELVSNVILDSINLCSLYVYVTEYMFLSAGNLSDEPMLLFPKRTFQPSTIRRKRNHGFFARYSSFSCSTLLNIQWQFKNLEYETNFVFSLSWVMVFTGMKSLIASSFSL